MTGSRSADLQIATILVDEQGHVTYLDSLAEEMTGFAAAEIIGRDVRTLTQSGESLTVGDTGRASLGDVVTLRRPDGTSRVVAARSHDIPLPHGIRVRLVYLIDIDGAQRTLSQLGLLDMWFHQAPFGYLIVDEQLRYVMVNRTLADYNNRPIHDHIGRHIREVLTSPDIDAYVKLLHDVLRTGEPAIDVSVPRSPTSEPGAHRVASASWFRLVNRDGLPLGLCGAIFDVSNTREQLLVDARSRERADLLGGVGALLGASLDMAKTGRGLAELLTSGFCDLAAIDVVETVISGEPADAAGDSHTRLYRLAGATRIDDPRANALIGRPGPRQLADSPGLSSVLGDHRPKLFRLNDEQKVAAPDWVKSTARELDANSYMVIPLRARDVTFGALSCLRVGGRTPFDADDLALATEIATRSALSIDNSRLYREERQTALILQLSLLPWRLPEIPEAALVYRHQPGHARRHAGGDWYDAITLPGHQVAMLVGDVTGHGVAAAAVMGRYRGVVQALTSIGLRPGALLTRLNQIAATFGENAMASFLYVHYDPWGNNCTISSAGHPPPIVALPGEPAEPLDVAGGPILGAAEDAVYESTSIETPPGTRLLLYTDGLIESRTELIETGIAGLARRMGSRRRPLPEHADELMASAPADNRDDRTLLLAELRGLDRNRTE